MYHGVNGGLASPLRFLTSTRASPDMPNSLQCQCIMAVLSQSVATALAQLIPPLSPVPITTVLTNSVFDK